eukprot:TRINITY_DN7371_c0_g1_i1.p1 TRINITY_DN7371_c0_g1~~TRINITY_DN7371_c0_g1_i1.p1  ORF type:complete len:453 (+),score=114.84 TRINITY_DN7371_c0_g1_i1:86-1444(+)
MVFGLKLGLPKAKGSADPAAEKSKGEEKAASASKGGGGGGHGHERSGGRGALTVNEFVARTKRCREKGLEPTKPELIAYARYLGIDPITDGDLMWIADEALAAPLPSEWTEHHDSADRIFYYNVQTHASSWTHPLEQLHRDTYKVIVNFRSGDLSKEEQDAELEKLRDKWEDSEREAHKELQAWSEHTDEGGQKFFYNRDKQVSVWTDPRPARCHGLYLQMRALKELSKHSGQAIGNRLDAMGPMDDSRREKLRIQQSFVIGSTDAMGRSGGTSRDRGRDTSGSDNDRGNANFADSGDKHDERRKEKKRHKKEKQKQKHDAGASGSQELLDLTEDDAEPPSESINGLFKKPALDLQKPTRSSVDEVRQALGVAPPGSGLSGGLGGGGLGGGSLGGGGLGGGGLGGGGLGGGGLPSIGGGGFSNRLPTPPGDGLSSVGRAKVRAGIRLEPLLG